MRENVLFEVTKDTLETGLRGVPVGYCTTSFVDPEKGLHYVGTPIKELVGFSPMEVIYLLYKKKKGSSQEIKAFEEEIRKRAFLKEETIKSLEALPSEGPATDLFGAALFLVGVHEGKEDYREDALNVIAKLPQIAACVINTHAKWGKTPQPKPELGYMENFVHMLSLPKEKSPQLIEVMRLFNILHYDHGGGNLSTFVGKAVASSLEPMWGSLAASMAALAGPKHGRANQDSLAFVEEALKTLGPTAQEAQVEEFLRKKIEKDELIFGFGHAVLRVEDARATVCYEYAEKHFSNHPLIKIAALLRKVGTKVLKENPKIADPYPNIDAITGSLLTAAGFEYPNYFTILFGLSRCIGIAMQIVYERLEAREGKGTPIVRPRYLYKPT